MAYIERELALKTIDNYSTTVRDTVRDIVDAICPAADVVKVRHGEWVYGEFDIPHCSECGVEVMPNNVSNYCPHCGADMRGEYDD